ncbi:DUF6557 family protein [Alkaliphilus sp. B6464]|uniref:DUF6557 family protein n=1 Tax=Alkaliphilus sp. B6464 TaxID=2731219 RepID=UPI001BAE0945|nr:DUF6557 family protein [Alkaliphilus sp. B6464]QUH22053.1 hypothetical protein HYG84_19295 [Alkaliphilus sp. B6464]
MFEKFFNKNKIQKEVDNKFIVKQLFHEIKFESIKKIIGDNPILFNIESNEFDKYERIYNILLNTEPKKNKKRWYINVYYYGIEVIKKKDDVARNSIIEHITWKEWLGFYIDMNVFKEYTKEEVASFIFDEMTYHGVTEDERLEYINSIKNNTSNENKITDMKKIRRMLKLTN